MMERVNDFWWVRLPAAAARFSRTMAGVLMDGRYLAAFPAASAWMPPALLVVGILVGWLHPGFAGDEVFTASLAAMALMVAVGEASAAWGAWIWLGFVAGDFLLFRHQAYGLYNGRFPGSILLARVPLLIPYILLALAAVFLPLTGRWLARGPAAARASAAGTAAMAALQAVVQAALLFTWGQAAPTLIRPVYTWIGGNPSTAVVRPLQAHPWVLPIVAGVLGAARVVLERRWSAHPAVTRRAALLGQALAARGGGERRLPVWAAAPLKAAFTTFLLSGVLTGWTDAILFAAAMAGMLVARTQLARRMGAWAERVARVPVLARFALGVAINFFVARWIITAMWASTSAFRPILISVTISLLVFLLLLPDAGARLARTRAPRGGPA
jgi:hypothetical protein